MLYNVYNYIAFAWQMQKGEIYMNENQDIPHGGMPEHGENITDKTQRLIAEGLAQGAAGNTAKVAEEGALRGLVDDKGNVSVDERAEEDLALLAGPVIPGIDKETRTAILSTFREVDEKIAAKPEDGTLRPEDITSIAQQLTSLGFKKEDSSEGTVNSIDAYLARKNLSDEEKSAIKEQLPEKNASSEDYRMSDREANVKGGVAERLRDVAERTADRVTNDIDQRPDLDDEQKRTLKEKVSGLFARITDVFAPGEPGRDWARRIGKTLYITLVIIFLFYIWEMNVINKVGGRK